MIRNHTITSDAVLHSTFIPEYPGMFTRSELNSIRDLLFASNKSHHEEKLSRAWDGVEQAYEAEIQECLIYSPERANPAVCLEQSSSWLATARNSAFSNVFSVAEKALITLKAIQADTRTTEKPSNQVLRIEQPAFEAYTTNGKLVITVGRQQFFAKSTLSNIEDTKKLANIMLELVDEIVVSSLCFYVTYENLKAGGNVQMGFKFFHEETIYANDSKRALMATFITHGDRGCDLDAPETLSEVSGIKQAVRDTLAIGPHTDLFKSIEKTIMSYIDAYGLLVQSNKHAHEVKLTEERSKLFNKYEADSIKSLYQALCEAYSDFPYYVELDEQTESFKLHADVSGWRKHVCNSENPVTAYSFYHSNQSDIKPMGVSLKVS